MTKVVSVITKYLTVDDTWDNDEIRNLALSMRDIQTEDVAVPDGAVRHVRHQLATARASSGSTPSKSKALFESDRGRRHRALPRAVPEGAARQTSTSIS